MKKLSLVFLFAAIALTSCFNPISEKVVFAVEDSINPVIVITDPEENSVYMSQVIIKGNVKDDALESGDNKGSLSSLSVAASTSLSHRGKIEIDSDGGYEADTDFGTISGEDFVYESTDRSFTIKIDTTEYLSQIMLITITAVDRNGNESKTTRQLTRSTGPYLELTSPTGSAYDPKESILIEGKLGNSARQKEEDDELTSLKLQISALGIDSTLYTADDTKVRLESRNGDQFLSYDKDNHTFRCNITLWDSEVKNSSNLLLIIIATDKNGITARVGKTLIAQAPDPIINTDEPSVSDDHYYTGNSDSFYSQSPEDSRGSKYSDLRFTGKVRINNPEATELNSLNLELSGGSGSTHTDTVASTQEGGSTSFSFDHTLSGDAINFFSRGKETVTAKLIAIDSEGIKAEQEWLIREDSEGPVFSDFSITTSNGRRYVGVNNRVTLGFKLEDAGVGIDTTSLRGRVGGISISSFDSSSDEDRLSYTVVVPLTDASQEASGDLEINITAEDKLGNATTANQDEFDFDSGTTDIQKVQFVPGTLSLTTVSIESKRSDLPTAAYPGDEVELTVVASQDLAPLGDAVTITITIAGENATVTTNSATEFTASVDIPNSYTTNPIPFSISGYKNLAGDAGSEVTRTTDGSSVTCLPIISEVAVSLEKDSGNTGGDDMPEEGDKVVLNFNVAATPPLSEEPQVSFEVEVGGSRWDLGSLTSTKDTTAANLLKYEYTYTIADKDIDGTEEEEVIFTVKFPDNGNPRNFGVVRTGDSNGKFKLTPAP